MMQGETKLGVGTDELNEKVAEKLEEMRGFGD